MKKQLLNKNRLILNFFLFSLIFTFYIVGNASAASLTDFYNAGDSNSCPSVYKAFNCQEDYIINGNTGECKTAAEMEDLETSCIGGTTYNEDKRDLRCDTKCCWPTSTGLAKSCASENRSFTVCGNPNGDCGACLAGFIEVEGTCIQSVYTDALDPATLFAKDGTELNIGGNGIDMTSASAGDILTVEENTYLGDNNSTYTVLETAWTSITDLIGGIWSFDPDSDNISYIDGDVSIGSANQKDNTSDLYVYGDLALPNMSECSALGIDDKGKIQCSSTSDIIKPSFVGVSSEPVNGDRDGYDNAFKACNNRYSGSHICSADEMIYSYEIEDRDLIDVQDLAWVNNGPPAYVENLSNDCSGWQSDSLATYGSVINFNRSSLIKKSFYIQPCSAKYKFACCK